MASESPCYQGESSAAWKVVEEEEVEEEGCKTRPGDFCMQKFRLYETRSNFYMVGRDQARTYWRVLKIDRLDPSELNILEDSTTYTERECSDLLRRINEGNKSTGGLKFVTTCYGIIGFIKFLGPYYMLLITKRRQIGAICGHNIYAISKCEMIPLLNSTACPSVVNSRDENRYKKLLCTVDLTKDFFFSYSYHIMRSLQKNLCDFKNGQVLYETMFVWNEFLTRGIRSDLQNTLWTVALVYGFFKQVTLSVSGREFILTLIARRSRHYAGTRYLKRGVNEKGRVANDVETEQILFENVPGVSPLHISSVVQNRGSIPLFWSQETSRLNIRPDIILSKKDKNYEATRLHFENLAQRYGNPIIILNLIKKQEKKPRESILRAEFAKAIAHLNRNLSEESRLMFLHWDLNKHSRSKATNALLLLSRIATYALTLTGFFYCQIAPTPISGESVGFPCPWDVEYDNLFPLTNYEDNDNSDFERKPSGGGNIDNENHSVNALNFQRGVLRTNCIDCLDRTNVAQYAYGLAALGQQLHALGAMDKPKIDLIAPLADELMGLYEKMGDTLAHQYGGSAAHNKIFSEIRGQWRAATQSQEFVRTLQRYYSNAYMDSVKQNAINIFLGHFQPEQGKPALWELDSDQHYNMGRNGKTYLANDETAFVERSPSDGNILHQSSSPSTITNVKQDNVLNPDLTELPGGDNIIVEASAEISTSERNIAYSSYTPTMPGKQFFGDMQVDNYLESGHICYNEHGDAFNCSNFVDLDWLSSSANSCEDELFDRSSILTPSPGMSSENVINGLTGETTPSSSEYGSRMKGRIKTETELRNVNQQGSNVLEDYTDSFVQWVNYGEMLCR